LTRPATLDLASVLVRLADLGPASEVRARAPEVAAEALGFDRVLLTGIAEGELVAEAVHAGGRADEELLATLRAVHVALDYPLIEVEVMRRRRVQVVVAAGDDPGRHAYAATLGWTAYVVAPVVLEGRVVGFIHADRRSGPAVGEEDAERLSAFATCFALVYDRALLRHRLRVQREELRQVASWAHARASDAGERSATLREEHEDGAPAASRPSDMAERALRDLLTRREIDVLELMVRGETNAGIARDLVVSEGTVKFHVKNILRKLHAANRAEATSRYLRLTLNRES
jgi:DNA-binding CsgD family transcriptional regulator